VIILPPEYRNSVTGAIARPMVEAVLREIYPTDITIHGGSFMSREIFSELVDLMIQGKVRRIIAKSNPLREIS
jgi:hypothetical protein